MPYTLDPYRRAHAIDLYTRAAALRTRLTDVTRDGDQLRIPAAYKYGRMLERITHEQDASDIITTETDFGTLTKADGVLTLTTPFGQTTHAASSDAYTLYDLLYQNAEQARALLWRAAHDELTPEEDLSLLAHLTGLDTFLLRETFTRALALAKADQMAEQFQRLLDAWRHCDDDDFVRETTPNGDLYLNRRRIVGVIVDKHLVTPIGSRRIQKNAPHKTWANLRKDMRRQLTQWRNRFDAERHNPSLTLVHTFYALEQAMYLWEDWSDPYGASDIADLAHPDRVRHLLDDIATMEQRVDYDTRLATFHPADGVDYARPIESFAHDPRLHQLRRLRANPDHVLYRLPQVDNEGEDDLVDYAPYVAFDERRNDITLTFDGQTERFAHIQCNRHGHLFSFVGDRFHYADDIEQDLPLPPALVQDAYARFVKTGVRNLCLTERLDAYDASPLNRSVRDELFHSLSYAALVAHHVFPSTASHLPQTRIRKLLRETHHNFQTTTRSPYRDGKPPKSYVAKALDYGLRQAGYDPGDTALSALPLADRIGLLENDVRHLMYLASFGTGCPAPTDACVRPERDALIDLFTRHAALMQTRADQTLGRVPAYVLVARDAYTDLVERLKTPWYDQLPERLAHDTDAPPITRTEESP